MGERSIGKFVEVLKSFGNCLWKLSLEIVKGLV